MSSQTDKDQDDACAPETTGQGDPTPKGNDCGCHAPPEGPDCDPDRIDDLKCQREGIKAQAEYNDKSGPDLVAAAKAFDTARAAYRDKRMEIDKDVTLLGEEVKRLIERIRCLFKDDGVLRCLDEAFGCVVQKLKDCKHDGGCCSTEPCNFTKDCPPDYNDLVRKISEYEARLEQEKACFDTLKDEPENLKKNLDVVEKEIEALKTTLSGDLEKVDLKKLYADALVAQRHLALVWNGFATTQQYVDCLCRALTCWTKASDALSALKGCLAIKKCQKRSKDERCADLKTKTAIEVLLEYERSCGSGTCNDPTDSGDSDCDDGDHKNDHKDDREDDQGGGTCGCDHGHPHNRQHHKHDHRHDRAS
jgi:hypothetical protein